MDRGRDGRRGKPVGGWKKEITNELTQVKLYDLSGETGSSKKTKKGFKKKARERWRNLSDEKKMVNMDENHIKISQMTKTKG